jgi:hypothetical protein
MKQEILHHTCAAGFAGLVLIMAGLSCAEEKNFIVVGAGTAFPSNGSGWITRHLETGWAASLEYSRRGEGRLAFYLDARVLDHSVDTAGTTEEDSEVNSMTYGLEAGLRYLFLTKEKLDFFAGAGAGFYASELRADSKVEDRASGNGLGLNIGASIRLTRRVFINGRVDYLLLLLGQGASFDDLSVIAGLGLSF